MLKPIFPLGIDLDILIQCVANGISERIRILGFFSNLILYLKKVLYTGFHKEHEEDAMLPVRRRPITPGMMLK
jgi:hypothetical protein